MPSTAVPTDNGGLATSHGSSRGNCCSVSLKELQRRTLNWCATGFSGTCIGSTMLGKHCFFLDIVVGPLALAEDPLCGGGGSAPATAGEEGKGEGNEEAAPPVVAAPQPSLHLVGDHVIQLAPRTVEGFLLERYGTSAVYTPAAEEGVAKEKAEDNLPFGSAADDVVSGNDEEGGSAKRLTSSPASSPHPPSASPLFVVSIYCGMNAHSLSPKGFAALSASLRANNNGVAAVVGRPHNVNGANANDDKEAAETAALLATLPPAAPRVGDVIAFPPGCCFSRPTDKGGPFPLRSVLGAMAPVLNATDGCAVVSRGRPHLPADFADKWQMEKRVRGGEGGGAAATDADKPPRKQKQQQQRLKRGGAHAHAEEKGQQQRAQKEGRAGHAARFNIFANWLAATFGGSARSKIEGVGGGDDGDEAAPGAGSGDGLAIIDVAGGGGKLSCELSLRGHRCAVVDPRIVPFERLSIAMDGALRQERHRAVTRAFRSRQLLGLGGGEVAATSEAAGIVVGNKRPRSDAEGAAAIANDVEPLVADPAPSSAASASAPLAVVAPPPRVRNDPEVAAQTARAKAEALGRIRLVHSLFAEADVDAFFAGVGVVASTDKKLRQQEGTEGEREDADGAEAAQVHVVDFAASSTFNELVASCDVIVGLHCDGAVNAIIEAACAHQKNFAIIPCCVFPTVFPRELMLSPSPAAPLDPPQEEGTEGNCGAATDLATAPPITSVPVIDRSELVAWIPQQARRLGYSGRLGTCIPRGLVGANACVYGVADGSGVDVPEHEGEGAEV